MSPRFCMLLPDRANAMLASCASYFVWRSIGERLMATDGVHDELEKSIPWLSLSGWRTTTLNIPGLPDANTSRLVTEISAIVGKVSPISPRQYRLDWRSAQNMFRFA